MSQTGGGRYCAGCMGKMEASGSCSNTGCRWKESSEPESQHHLPRHYILQDRYYIGRVLGQGGFGVTYIGRDLRLDRLVAIKEYLPVDECWRGTNRMTVIPHGGEKTGRFHYGLERFLSEAQNVARLGSHPNIVTISDHIEANSTAYIIMEFIEGATLKQYLAAQGGRIPPETAKNIMLHAMAGLRRMHENGMLHRDISPDNIMLSRQGPVKLIDFGAARNMLGEASQNMSVILKHGYAPEEQYRSRGKQGPWTDVYATAATLYRCITGEVPPQALERLNGGAILRRPATMCPQLPPIFETALLKGLAVKADNRFRSMDEFKQALLNPEAQPSPAPSPAPIPPVPQIVKREIVSPLGPAQAPTPPALHWFAVLALSVVTLGMFPLVWIFVQSSWIRRIYPDSRARTFFSIYTAIWMLAFCLLYFGCVSAAMWKGATVNSFGNAFGELSGITMLIALIGTIFFYFGVFDMRQSLLIYYNTVQPIGLRLSGGMTFFFSILYIQYHLTRIDTYMRTGYLSA